MRRADIDPEILKKWYHDPTLTVAQVAEKVGVRPQNLIDIIRRHNIPTRKQIGLNAISHRFIPKNLNEIYSHISDDDIREHYHDEMITVEEAAAKLNISSPPTLVKLVRARGIPTRKELGITKMKFRKSDVIEALQNSDSIKMAAQALRTSDTVIYGLIRHFELKKPKYKRRKSGPKNGQRSWNCETCQHRQWCDSNPYTERLPCELEATPHIKDPKLNTMQGVSLSHTFSAFGGKL